MIRSRDSVCDIQPETFGDKLGAMSLFSRKPSKTASDPPSVPAGRLVFASTAALERALDGTDETFARYYFAVYHCSPTEAAGINERREQLRDQYPEKAAEVGRFFVLWGEPAYLALSAYYLALAGAETLSQEYRDYAERRRLDIDRKHLASQSLPQPVDLSEGQLSADPDLEFFASVALLNGQIVPRP